MSTHSQRVQDRLEGLILMPKTPGAIHRHGMVLGTCQTAPVVRIKVCQMTAVLIVQDEERVRILR